MVVLVSHLAAVAVAAVLPVSDSNHHLSRQQPQQRRLLMPLSSRTSSPAAAVSAAAATALSEHNSWFGSGGAERALLQRSSRGGPSTAPGEAPGGVDKAVYATRAGSNTSEAGTSYNNPRDFPVPAGYEPVISAVHRIIGPYVIKGRKEMEQAFQNSFRSYFEPLGIEIRWLNYTTRPSTNIGTEGSYLRSSMRSVDEQVLMYQRADAADRSNLTLGLLMNQTAYLQQLVTVEYGFQSASLVVLSEAVVSDSFALTQDLYGAAASRVELYGQGLIPFSVDKQNVVLLTLQQVFSSLIQSPVFYLNISNYSPTGDVLAATAVGPAMAPQTAGRRRLARRLLQQEDTPNIDTVVVVVWTGLQPLRGVNMADLWNRTLYENNAQELYVTNGDGSIGVAYTYRNFTGTSQYYGISMTGQFKAFQLYQRSDNGTNLSEWQQPVGAPYSLPEAPAPAPASAPEPVTGPEINQGGNLGSEGRPVPLVSPTTLESHSSSPKVGLIAGIAVGAAIFVALLLVGAGLFALRRQRAKAARTAAEKAKRALEAGTPASSPSNASDSDSSSLADGRPSGDDLARVGSEGTWRWDALGSGVLEPVVAGRICRQNSKGSAVDLLPSLHRAHELFANDTAQQSPSLGLQRAGSLPQAGVTQGSFGESAEHFATDRGTYGNGKGAAPGSSGESSSSSGLPHSSMVVASPPAGGAPAPFVAGEIDPVEIEFCRDSSGKRIVLGEGAFGRVYKGLRRGVHEVAIKQLGNLNDPQLIRQFRKEITILGRVSFQPNIVNFYGACLRDPANIMLIMELMAGGDLRHALSSSEDGRFKWHGKGRSLALDIAHGLHFLHSSQVTHRDLKTSNILLSRDGNTAKIGDVGLSRSMLTDLQSSNATVGTFCYAAPELLMGERCTEAIDLFSFGVCLWEVVTGQIPTRGYMRDVDVPKECPEEIRQLIADCMESDPSKRPTAEELVRRIQACPLGRPDEGEASEQCPGSSTEAAAKAQSQAAVAAAAAAEAATAAAAEAQRLDPYQQQQAVERSALSAPVLAAATAPARVALLAELAAASEPPMQRPSQGSSAAGSPQGLRQ